MYLRFEGAVIHSETLESIDPLWIETLIPYLQNFVLNEAGMTNGKLPFTAGFEIVPDETSIRLNENGEYYVKGTCILITNSAYEVVFIGKPDTTSSTIDWRIEGFPVKEFKDVLQYYLGNNKIRGALFSLPDVHIEIELKAPLDSEQESLILELVKSFCKERGFYCSDEFFPNESLTKGLHLDYVVDPTGIESLIGELADGPKWKDNIKAIIVS